MRPADQFDNSSQLVSASARLPRAWLPQHQGLFSLTVFCWQSPACMRGQSFGLCKAQIDFMLRSVAPARGVASILAIDLLHSPGTAINVPHTQVSPLSVPHWLPHASDLDLSGAYVPQLALLKWFCVQERYTAAAAAHASSGTQRADRMLSPQACLRHYTAQLQSSETKVLQLPPPMTEDALAEREQALTALGEILVLLAFSDRAHLRLQEL